MTTEETTHQQILPLLDSQLGFAGALEYLLQAEYQALLTSDLNALAELVAKKRLAAESLEKSSSALAQSTGGEPAAVMPRLGGIVLQRWQQLGDVADRLRRQNLCNGALLNERQNRLRWVAERAGGEMPALYAPKASSHFAPGLSGRSLARA